MHVVHPICPNEPASVVAAVRGPVGAVRHIEAGEVVLVVLSEEEAVGAAVMADNRPRSPRRRTFST